MHNVTYLKASVNKILFLNLMYNAQAMELSKIKQFAVTVRLGISDEEALGLAGDLEATLGYIDQINAADISDAEIEIPEHRNAVREDVVTTVTGSYTEAMLAQAVAVQDGFVKVKKII